MNVINVKLPILIFSYFYCLFMSLVNMQLAVVILFVFVSFVLTKGILSSAEKFFVFFFVLINFIFNSYNFDPISGVDEQAFISNIRNTNIIELFLGEIKSLFDTLGFISSRITFSAFLSVVFLNKDFVTDEYVIFLINTFLWFVGSHVYLSSIKNKRLVDNIKIGYLFLFLSPTILYWTGNFGKDVVVVSFCMLSAAFFLQKKFALFFLFAIIALLFRPYSLVMIACFVVPLVYGFRVMSALFILITLVFLYGTKFAIEPLINTVLAFIYVFLSPNPVSINNWTLVASSNGFSFSPLIMLVEALIISFLIFYAVLFKKYDKYKVLKTFIAIYCLSICLVGVGYTNISSNDEALAIGSLGDNFVRKKIIVWPLLALLLNFFYGNKHTDESSSYNKIPKPRWS